MVGHDLNVLSPVRWTWEDLRSIKVMGRGLQQSHYMAKFGWLGEVYSTREKPKEGHDNSLKYSPGKEVKRKTHAFQPVKHNLDTQMTEEGIQVSLIFNNLGKNLSCAAKKQATLNFQWHRIVKKLIKGHVFKMVDVWMRWPTRKFLVSKLYSKNIKNYHLKNLP